MSTAAPLGGASAGRRGRASDATSRLRLVGPGVGRAPRMPFALVVLVVIGAGLLGLLFLNTLLAQHAFTLHDLQQRSVLLADREQELRVSLARYEAPATLARRARTLGMAPGGAPLFLRLPDGAVLGDPSAATARPAPPPAPTPSAGPSTKASTTPSARASANPSARPSTEPTAGPSAKPSTPPATRATPIRTASPATDRGRAPTPRPSTAGGRR